MHFDAETRSIMTVKHGSHAYGLNTPASDIDIKGVCIEPISYHFGFVDRFEQYERMASKGNESDKVIYSLKKFARLAADCNPNIIEVLWGDDSDILYLDTFGRQLREARESFISKKARHTFAGYAHAQLKRIKTHRAWLLNPPTQAPDRRNFGLTEETKVSKSELGAYDSMLEQDIEVEFPKDVVTLFTKEKAYQSARTHWEQYVNWTKTRNPKRAELEAKHGLDTKHAMHLVRLMRMCKEILVTGKVVVKRPDREELLAIRNGEWSYDRIVEHAETLEVECDALYETSTLRYEPDRATLDALVIDITQKYLDQHG